jgi:hypothetical protein
LDPEVTVWNLLEFEFLEVEGVIADLVVTLKNHNFKQIPVLPSNYYGRDGTNSTLQSGRLLDVVHKVSHVLVDGVAKTLLEGDQVFILAVFLGVDLGDVLKLSRLFRDLVVNTANQDVVAQGHFGGETPLFDHLHAVVTLYLEIHFDGVVGVGVAVFEFVDGHFAQRHLAGPNHE